jgi:hypothetical protein
MSKAATPDQLPGVPGERYGRATRHIENAHCWVEVLAGGGPRIVGFGLAGGPNILAETPEAGWDAGHGMFEPVGGHRLWFAPETPDCSVPDAIGLEMSAIPGGVRLTGAFQAPSGLRKTLEIRLDADAAALELRHVLANEGARTLDVSPWAITQLRLGGVAAVELPAPRPEHTMAPGHVLVMWPYGSWVDERLTISARALTVLAVPGSAFKVGCLSTTGEVGYLLDDVLFVKRFAPGIDLPHADMGCNVEIYTDQGSIELETLGPLVKLAPGQSAVHVERWSAGRVGEHTGHGTLASIARA